MEAVGRIPCSPTMFAAEARRPAAVPSELGGTPPSAARRLEAGERIYTNSENALAWILGSRGESRRSLHAIRPVQGQGGHAASSWPPSSPGLFHETRSIVRGWSSRMNVADLPSAGGVETLRGVLQRWASTPWQSREDWAAARWPISLEARATAGTTLLSRKRRRQQRVPSSWRATSTGTEYALDAYFDEDGARAHPEHPAPRLRLGRGHVRPHVPHRAPPSWTPGNDAPFAAWLAAG